jgi:nucleotide-binding universal stress UspA family protein
VASNEQRTEPERGDSYRVLVGVDYSPLSELAVAEALRLTEAHDGELHCLTVAEGAGPGLPEKLMADEKQKFVREAEATLESFLGRRFAALDAEHHRDRVRAHVAFGDPAEQILALARALGVDLIAVGTRGRHGLDQAILGSVAERVLRHAGCSVLVVRSKREASR